MMRTARPLTVVPVRFLPVGGGGGGNVNDFSFLGVRGHCPFHPGGGGGVGPVQGGGGGVGLVVGGHPPMIM